MSPARMGIGFAISCLTYEGVHVSVISSTLFASSNGLPPSLPATWATSSSSLTASFASRCAQQPVVSH